MDSKTTHTNSISLIPGGMEEEIARRIAKVRDLMPEDSALLLSTNVNVFYLTGRFFRGYVWLPKKGDPFYFVVKPRSYSVTDNIVYIRKPELIPEVLESMGISIKNPLAVGIEEDVLSYTDAARLMKVFNGADTFNASPILRNSRMVKTPYEIEQMRVDGHKQVSVYKKVPSLYRPGMTDIGLQIEIERELRLAGCLGFARVSGNLMEINLGSVLVGANADNPSPYEFAMGGAGADLSLPGGANGTEILPGETVMVDMNGSFNAYQTDMTRVWSLGDLPDIAYKAHACSIRILRVLEQLAVPGVEVSALYNKAVEIAEEEGLKEYFMGHSQQSGFIGHGVGIELNEQPPVAPRTKTLLQAGMTLALEPKFVIPEVGAVGVENTYVVRDYGLECLTEMEEEISNI